MWSLRGLLLGVCTVAFILCRSIQQGRACSVACLRGLAGHTLSAQALCARHLFHQHVCVFMCVCVRPGVQRVP